MSEYISTEPDTGSHSHTHNETPHSHDFAAANQKHFDAEAKAFDVKPSAIEMAKRISKAMLDTYPTLFNEDKTTVMDFACGTGKYHHSTYCIYIYRSPS